MRRRAFGTMPLSKAAKDSPTSTSRSALCSTRACDGVSLAPCGIVLGGSNNRGFCAPCVSDTSSACTGAAVETILRGGALRARGGFERQKRAVAKRAGIKNDVAKKDVVKRDVVKTKNLARENIDGIKVLCRGNVKGCLRDV